MEPFANLSEVDGSYIGFVPNFIDENEQKLYMSYFKKLKDWKRGKSSFGKDIPRLQKWHHRDGHYFSKNWKERHDRWRSCPYDDTLTHLEQLVSERFQKIASKLNLSSTCNATPNFNSILINYYRNQNDSINPHQDNQEEFGTDPTILGLSLGHPRTITFNRIKYNPSYPQSKKLDKHRFSIPLESGTLLIMAGTTQTHYVHGIEKETTNKKIGSRFSCTFREHSGGHM